MIVCMRTSVNIPDALLDRAREKAAAEHTTVTDLVVEGLRARVQRDTETAGSARVVLPSRNLCSASVNLDDNQSVQDALETDDEFRARH